MDCARRNFVLRTSPLFPFFILTPDRPAVTNWLRIVIFQIFDSLSWILESCVGARVPSCKKVRFALNQKL